MKRSNFMAWGRLPGILVYNVLMNRFLFLPCLISLALSGADAMLANEITFPFTLDQTEKFRRPSAMCLIDAGQKLVVANPRAGSLSLVNLETKSVQAAHLGGTPSAVAWLARKKQFLVVESDSGSLLVASVGDDLSVQHRLFVGRSARGLAVAPGEHLLAVSSVWDRTVSLISPGECPRLMSQVRLDFEPLHLCFSLDGTLLLVCDAFGDQLSVLDVETGMIHGPVRIRGHQIRGVAFLSHDRFVLTHQILHEDAATTEDNIASGLVIENVIQEFRLSRGNSGQVEFEPLLINEIGVPSHGAADPGAIVLDHSGGRFIALAGVHEVAVLNAYGVVRDRITVGERPVALLLSPDEKQLYCLNQFSDSISIVNLDQNLVSETLSLGPQPLRSPRERGEELFFDGHRSRFSWFSCHSCHVDGHTNGQLADTFGDETAGAPKRVLSLLGGRDNNPWGWNGSMRSLHDQVLKSGVTTMRGSGFTAREANDVVAYLHTLRIPPPFRPAEDVSHQKQIETGRQLFATWGCVQCHVPPLTYTSDANYDIGIGDEHGQRTFNPPSLKGVGYRRAFFHDGRARTLRDVFVDHGHQLSNAPDPDELAALLRFLESL